MVKTYTLTIILNKLSRNFSDWFTVGKRDELSVSTLLPTPIGRTTPNVLLVLGRTIFYFGMSSNLMQIGKTVTQIFEQAQNEDSTKCTI